MLMKLTIIMLSPVSVYCERFSDFMLIEAEKNRNRESQHAHFVLNMKAYMLISTATGKYNSVMPVWPSTI